MVGERCDIIGKTFFDLFFEGGCAFNCMTNCVSPLDESRQGSIVKILSSSSTVEGGIYCSIQVLKVLLDDVNEPGQLDNDDRLRYYAIFLEKLEIESMGNALSVVYELPIPSPTYR